ncbi:bifunctional proline dehydrogenase/L-glutamate gamma-semialdehyde dehydrogenase PutA [Neptuniibacter sp. QD72_48]|uniref:bifunctional proline dehydrogenase/L-glutamate gamma-semialdehyde dehydrogenase PutA n=1 Tax=unclassified Neptuniibacter TaxID=2630693 RepID=UPI0039F51785
MLPVSQLLSAEISPADQDTLWRTITDYYCHDETSLCDQLLEVTPNSSKAKSKATDWVNTIRNLDSPLFSVNTLMSEFGLESDEGIALLALAEALLRIPDTETAQALIYDKLDSLALEPAKFLKAHSTFLENGTFWGIALSQKLISKEHSADSILNNVWQRLGNSVVHQALAIAVSQIGKQFVFAEDINTALELRCDYNQKTFFSFDMLGEAAVCDQDAQTYFEAYLEAIQTAGQENPEGNTSISIKLSALHPRLENSHFDQLQKQLMHKLFQLLVTARNLDVAITIDAEESERLEITLLIFEQLLRSELCLGWGKLGLAVQAYSKRALPTLRWLSLIASDCETPIPIRLVKGAYWDSEIKHSQQNGLTSYPVFTHKAATDLSYLTCAKFLLSHQSGLLSPQFATHNALTIAQIIEIPTEKTFEFQRLHGMADPLYQQVLSETDHNCRIYAPVGNQNNLLPYLVRRLLENGANSSFVFQLHDPNVSTEEIVESPLKSMQSTSYELPLPSQVFEKQRENSAGEPLGSLDCWQQWRSIIEYYGQKKWYCQPIIAGEVTDGLNLQPVHANYRLDKIVGYQSTVDKTQIKQAISIAEQFFPEWRDQDVSVRCKILMNYARLLEQNKAELVSLCILETGKTLQDALAEVREAIDFCFYYAALAEKQLLPQHLPSVTGEENTLHYQGHGVFLCISPWNFPLAIFTGQIAAALVCGNTVLAKPSSNSGLTAFKATELWYAAGLPEYCLQLIPYAGAEHSEALLTDSRIAGVTFTGSTQAASTINKQLANRHDGSIIPFVAETGGLNAMIADSSALIEQVVLDAIHSAFNSAGQRCSALRVLYVQEEIAEVIEEKLIGAMQTLKIGSPEELATDLGPVINQNSMQRLYEHIERCRLQDKLLFELELSDQHNQGCFVPPTLIRLNSMDELTGEVFGPILHIIRYQKHNLERVIYDINRSGFGLTLGVHSRNDLFIEQITTQALVGNIYINRDQIGAIVGSQPFGGMGLSGTGPKAGGPNYLKRFVCEKTITRNTTASGGNRTLLSKKL